MKTMPLPSGCPVAASYLAFETAVSDEEASSCEMRPWPGLQGESFMSEWHGTRAGKTDELNMLSSRLDLESSTEPLGGGAATGVIFSESSITERSRRSLGTFTKSLR